MNVEDSLGLALFASLTVASFSALLAFGRHKSQKAWEAKYATYQDVFTALHGIKFWAEEAYASSLELPTISTSSREQLEAEYGSAKASLSRNVLLGRLLMSEKTVAALDAMLTEISRVEAEFQESGSSSEDFLRAYTAYLVSIKNVVEENLPVLLKLAKRDLK
ncbi:MAG: hypothetical protein AAF545_00025 [Pseudomonadota bacterium]